jgi:hypothetical protein
MASRVIREPAMLKIQTNILARETNIVAALTEHRVAEYVEA